MADALPFALVCLGLCGKRAGGCVVAVCSLCGFSSRVHGSRVIAMDAQSKEIAGPAEGQDDQVAADQEE